jgi:predicted nucleic acid-binding protein
MIVVDSSVLIANFREAVTPEVEKFSIFVDDDDILIGDLVLLEVLQGTRNDRHARDIIAVLSQFAKANMLDTHIAVESARHFRQLRALGITIRKTTDLIIGTFCIVENHVLLHDDRDFDPMQRFLGLQVA